MKRIKNLLLNIIHSFHLKKVSANISVLGPSDLLTGRIALITGGTSGIGFAIAEKFIQAGAKVIITGRNEEKNEKACKRLKEKTGKDCFSIVLDVKNVSLFDSVLSDIQKKIGIVDILVNNAGILGGHISKATDDEFDDIIATNTKSVFFLTRSFADNLISHKKNGNILNIASSSSYRPANSVYGISKWAIRGFTQGMARSLAAHNIIVNGIAPGPTLTPMLQNEAGDNLDKPNSLIKRYIMPDEIASVAVLLCSGLGSCFIGEILCMTGGSGTLTNEDYNYQY